MSLIAVGVYLGNSPRAYPGVFRGYGGADANAYDRAHEFPFTYGELVPYYDWVERTLPVETAAMGKKELEVLWDLFNNETTPAAVRYRAAIALLAERDRLEAGRPTPWG